MLKTKLWVLGAVNPIKKADTFSQGVFNDLTSLAITVFGIGVVVCALGVWKGDEENVHKFKKGLTWTVIAFVIAVLAKGILAWVKAGFS